MLTRSTRICSFAIAGVFLLLAVGSTVSVAWRWGRPYLLGDSMARYPRIFLWAWERPEDLRFLNPNKTGVAVLAKTLILDGTQIRIYPRLQPIQLPPGITTLAAVRIEGTSAVSDGTLIKKVIEELQEFLDGPAAGIQIDFDARVSERKFYRRLLEELRQILPSGKLLSITALASWCIHDDWISDLPVDEAVPMLFRMGVDEDLINRYLSAGQDFLADRSRFSLGLSMDEPPAAVPRNRRIYLFNPHPWTEESFKIALRRVKEQQ